MLIILYGILTGILTALILCAPYTYYPLFAIILLVSIIVYIVSRKFFKPPCRTQIGAAAALFIISYSLCTYVIFKPADFHYANVENTSSDKKAVIFYCEGEMEKYTPYYTKNFINGKPLLLKPFYAYNIKKIYKQIGVNKKNEQLAKTASEVKTSILNYKPYYFYISFSNYVPDIRDSIFSAISDGCREITIINYTSNTNLENEISKAADLDKLKDSGIKIKFTPSITTTETFTDYFLLKITNMPFKWDGILILDEENFASSSLKKKLANSGYKENQILISNDIESSINYFKENNAKSLLYVNIKDSSIGLESVISTPKAFEKYSQDMKITGIEDWGFDKRLVKACIEVFLKVEGK